MRTLRRAAGALFAAMLVCALPRSGHAQFAGLPRTGMQQVTEPGLLCRNAIRLAEAGSALPPHMLGDIARVESGRTDPVTRRFHPWPWTINAEGRDYYFDTKAEAVAFARQLVARGVRSFDTGCMQVNMMFHPDAFQSLEEAFDPIANARYAVRFLTQLREKTGSWETASAWYHSANPEHGDPYRARVITAMADDAKLPGNYGGLPQATGPTPMSSMPMPQGGNVMMLRGSTFGMVLPRPAGGFGMAMTGQGGTTAGRGLDSYRMQPVAIVGARQVASR